jgi:hypothetical protein
MPAVVAVALGPITAIRRDWTPIWLLWALMVLLLALVVVTAVRTLRGPTPLPPAWAVFLVAWVTGVAAWSPRDLRVEWFSVPLGLAVLAAGALHFVVELRGGRDDAGEREVEAASRRTSWVGAGARSRLAAWPAGSSGSWRLLGPGIVLTLLPSTLATGTDPQTWRAILVIAAALLAVVLGAGLRLRAPFILGLVTLPLENVIVFAVQIGRSIGALPWWITLATAGAVLLALAVGSERRAAQGRGVAARMRELR